MIASNSQPKPNNDGDIEVIAPDTLTLWAIHIPYNKNN